MLCQHRQNLLYRCNQLFLLFRQKFHEDQRRLYIRFNVLYILECHTNSEKSLNVNCPHTIKMPSVQTRAPVAKIFFLISHRYESSSLSIHRVLLFSLSLPGVHSKKWLISIRNQEKTFSPVGALFWAEGIFIIWG